MDIDFVITWVDMNDPEWLEEFSTFSIYKIFPVLQALWEGNMEALDVAKKKLEP